MTDFPSYHLDGGNTIHFEYLKPLPFEVAEEVLSRWLLDACRAESKNVLSITIVFCTDQYLQEINSRHLNQDYYTDVISFPYRDDPIEGDLFISVDRVIENANTFGDGNVERELYRIIIHGILHLCGYTDKEAGHKLMMTKREDLYLQKLSLLS